MVPRNLDRRVEAMVPNKRPTVHAQVLDRIMAPNPLTISKAGGSALKARRSAPCRSGRGAVQCCHYSITDPNLSDRGQAPKDHMQPRADFVQKD
jgi:polyphosphate kinase